MQLLRHGVDVNALDADGRTALHEAAKRGHYRVAEVLLRAGANVEMPEKHFGNTALHEAARYGRTSMCKVLLVGGAVKDATNQRLHTPAELAEEQGHLRTIQTIVTHCRDRELVGDVLDEIERLDYNGHAGAGGAGGAEGAGGGDEVLSTRSSARSARSGASSRLSR